MQFLSLFYVFIIYAIAGFFVETAYTSVLNHRFMHRGFLFGPYIPIYGFGAAFITLLVQRFEPYPVLVFMLSFVLCSALEYITSFILEKLFHARWWDYSKQFMNLNGRICLKNSTLFGVGGIVIVEIINKELIDLEALASSEMMRMIGFFLFGVISVDFITSMLVMWNIKQTIDLSFGDNTETIKEQKVIYVKDQLEDMSEELKNEISRRSIIHKRIMNAFDIRINTGRLIEKINKRNNL